jgi:hypothetical protein
MSLQSAFGCEELLGFQGNRRRYSLPPSGEANVAEL